MINRRLYMVLLLMVFGNSTYSQDLVWEYVRTYSINDEVFPNRMQSMTELESGDIIVNASWKRNGFNGRYSENPGIMKFSGQGELQREVYWSRLGYRSDDQYIIESPDHEVIVLGHFLPDRTPDAPNTLPEASDKAYLYFYKLDRELNMLDSVEYVVPLDTTNNAAYCQSTSFSFHNIEMAKIKLTSAFVEGGQIVGSYTKTQTRYNHYGLDSLFFFKMDFDGNLLMQKAISLGDRGSDPYAFNDQMVSNDTGYVHYHVNKRDTKAYTDARNVGDMCILLDKDFNFVKNMGVPVTPHDGPRYIDFEMVRKSPWGTTFLSCLIDYSVDYVYGPNALLMEMDENDGTVRVLHRKEAVSADYDMTALRSPVSFTGSDAFFWAYTRDRGLGHEKDSWIMIEKLDCDFGLMQSVYYPFKERTNINANSYIATRDGGLLLLSYCYDLDDAFNEHYILTKFPAEAFLGVEEAHQSGLKVAVAYPNPGKDELNIRTGLRDAFVEVYDPTGRRVHVQAVGGDVATINAQRWPSGVYVWKVYSGGRMAETGKWVKE